MFGARTSFRLKSNFILSYNVCICVYAGIGSQADPAQDGLRGRRLPLAVILLHRIGDVHPGVDRLLCAYTNPASVGAHEEQALERSFN